VCADTVEGAPDSIVINYFTNDTKAMQTEAATGQRYDCTGSDVGNDPSNDNRRNKANPLAAPLQPLLVSNRYWLNSTNTEIDKQAITTLSLACSGNGQYGSVTGGSTSNSAQPLLPGIEDMQITYGVFASTSASNDGVRTPDKFYTATEVRALSDQKVDNGLGLTPMSPWSRVVAVRVCIMTKSMGSSPKIADKAGTERTYIDCNGATPTQGASDTFLRKRFVQIFPVRNLLGQTF
jgi:type IV pilus assembly protein PilW